MCNGKVADGSWLLAKDKRKDKREKEKKRKREIP